MANIKLSQSSVKLWRKCKFAWAKKYIDRIIPKKKSRPFQVGIICHEMIEHEREGKDPFKVLDKYEKKLGKFFEEEREVYGDILNDIRVIMKGYYKHWKKKPLKSVKYKGKVAEHYIEVPLLPGIDFIAYFDEITFFKGNWLTEHKTGKKEVSQEVRFWDIQSMIYLWAMRELGFKVKGILWNWIKSFPPTKPQQLKNGALSVSKNINTTWAVYREEIKRLGLKEKDYKEIKEAFEGAEERFYSRVRLPANEKVIETVLADFKATALEIQNERHNEVQPRSLNFMCVSCDYYLICQTEMRGYDAEDVKKKEYKTREKREREEPPKKEKRKFRGQNDVTKRRR